MISYLRQLKTSIHLSNTYYALTAPRYSRVGERHVDGEIENLELKTPNDSP